MKQENVGIEELVQLSAAVSDPPTAALALTASNTVLLLFTEPVLSIATAEPLAADDLTMLLDGVIVTAASTGLTLTPLNGSVYEIDLGLTAPAVGGETLVVNLAPASTSTAGAALPAGSVMAPGRGALQQLSLIHI